MRLGLRKGKKCLGMSEWTNWTGYSQPATNRSHNPDLILKERSSRIFPARRGHRSQISNGLIMFVTFHSGLKSSGHFVWKCLWPRLVLEEEVVVGGVSLSTTEILARWGVWCCMYSHRHPALTFLGWCRVPPTHQFLLFLPLNILRAGRCQQSDVLLGDSLWYIFIPSLSPGRPGQVTRIPVEFLIIMELGWCWHQGQTFMLLQPAGPPCLPPCLTYQIWRRQSADKSRSNWQGRLPPPL